MPRVIWKGAITFGLVHIPVNLYPGSTASALDLDLLDKRDYAPVGYRRVNKRTGKEVAPADTVKGFEYKDGQYVVLSEEDFRQANVKPRRRSTSCPSSTRARFPPITSIRPITWNLGSAARRGMRCSAKPCARADSSGSRTWCCGHASISPR
jgi:Ku70/Ku80 beta-barrel domain